MIAALIAPRSIRGRLSLLSAAIVALLGGVCGVLLYYFVSFKLEAEVEDFAEHEAQEVAIIASRFATDKELKDAGAEFDPLFPEIGVLELEVMSPTGESMVRLTQGERAREEFDKGACARVLNSEAVVARTRDAQRHEVRCLQVVRGPAGPRWIVSAVTDSSHIDTTLRQFAFTYVGGLACIVAAVWGGSWFLLLLFTRPLNRVIKEAREIVEERSETLLTPGASGSELSELVELLNRLIRNTRETLARLKRFTSDVGHEVRTPLTRIQAAAEQALQRKIPEDLEGTLHSILEETNDMRGLIDALLELARGEAIGVRFLRTLSLNELLEPLIDAGQALASEKEIRLRLLTPLEGSIEGHDQLLQRAFWNVIENAVKFSPVGSTVDVSVTAGGEGVLVTVDDQGPGVSKGDLERIFEPFFQAAPRTAERNGYGLGLTLARSIVRRHSGEVWAEPGAGGGLRMMIRLPHRQPQAAAAGYS